MGDVYALAGTDMLVFDPATLRLTDVVQFTQQRYEGVAPLWGGGDDEEEEEAREREAGGGGENKGDEEEELRLLKERWESGGTEGREGAGGE